MIACSAAAASMQAKALCTGRTGRVKQGTGYALPLPGFKLAD